MDQLRNILIYKGNYSGMLLEFQKFVEEHRDDITRIHRSSCCYCEMYGITFWFIAKSKYREWAMGRTYMYKGITYRSTEQIKEIHEVII